MQSRQESKKKSARENRIDEARCFALLWAFIHRVACTPEFIDLCRVEHDPPDFVIDHEGKSIGIEHTKAFHQPHRLVPRHTREIQLRIKAEIERLIRTCELQDADFDLSLTFGSCDDVQPRDEQAVAQQIFDFLLVRWRATRSSELFLHQGELKCVAKCLRDALLIRTSARPLISTHASGRVDEDGRAVVQVAANRKSADLEKYRVKYDECWLMAEVGGFNQAHWIEPFEGACQGGIVTKFDRVFVVDPRMGKIWEFRCLAPEIAGA